MELFTVMWGDSVAPFLVTTALGRDEAVASCEEQRKIGAFEERGYDDRGDHFSARPATPSEKNIWSRSVDARVAEGVLDDPVDAEDNWTVLLAQPDFEPDEDDPDED